MQSKDKRRETGGGVGSPSMEKPYSRRETSSTTRYISNLGKWLGGFVQQVMITLHYKKIEALAENEGHTHH